MLNKSKNHGKNSGSHVIYIIYMISIYINQLGLILHSSLLWNTSNHYEYHGTAVLPSDPWDPSHCFIGADAAALGGASTTTSSARGRPVFASCGRPVVVFPDGNGKTMENHGKPLENMGESLGKTMENLCFQGHLMEPMAFKIFHMLSPSNVDEHRAGVPAHFRVATELSPGNIAPHIYFNLRVKHEMC